MSSVGIKRVFAVIAAAAAAACIDMSPLLDAKDADAGTSDAAVKVDAAVEASCSVCLFESEVCATPWAACRANDTCRLLTECGVAAGCLTLLNLQDQATCALPCVESVGVKSATDPALFLGLELNVCKLNHCAQACGGAA